MRGHGHQPRHAGSHHPTPPSGGTGVRPPPADDRRLVEMLEFVDRLGTLARPRREALREAANQLRTIPALQAEVERLSAELAAVYARAPHLVRPACPDADLPAVGSFAGG